jgi:hypothetical protein
LTQTWRGYWKGSGALVQANTVVPSEDGGV